MGDLYSGLIQPYLRKGKNGEQFWGLYDPLDKVNIPDSSQFLKIQIAGLKALEAGKDYSATNDFLKRVGALSAQHDSAENQINEDVYSRIIEILNSGLRGSPINPYKYLKGNKTQRKQQVNQNIEALSQELQHLLSSIGASDGLSASMVNSLEKRLRNFEWDSFPHEYIMEKADLIEALMVDQMNQDPALRAIVTGAWTDLDGKQLIEDAFAFSTKEAEIPFVGGSLKYSLKVDGQSSSQEAVSIDDFLNQLDSLKGKKFTVQLSDELYDALKAGSSIAGQAKSGMHGQAILNKNKRNSISLGEAGFDPMLLWNLYQADLQTRTSFFKPENQQSSKDLEALSNYCLSKSIAKTALKDNQVYLTAEGFVSASQWMELNSRYLIFSPAVRSVGGDFLIRQRPYVFT